MMGDMLFAISVFSILPAHNGFFFESGRGAFHFKELGWMCIIVTLRFDVAAKKGAPVANPFESRVACDSRPKPSRE